jgi:hypothetical protein
MAGAKSFTHESRVRQANRAPLNIFESFRISSYSVARNRNSLAAQTKLKE